MILGRQLQELRVRAGLSFEAAAEAIFVSAWTIRRMENGEVGLKLNNVRGLLARYGVAGPEIEAFLTLAREANRPGWWHSYSDVLPSWFRIYVGLEEAASLIRCYEPQVVPGLLQTREYARALTVAGFPDAGDEEIERRVSLRMARQSLLTRPDPPRLWAVIEEAALRRMVGGPTVMAGQLKAAGHDGGGPAECDGPGAAAGRRCPPGDVRAVHRPALPPGRPARRRLHGEHDQRRLPRQNR
jgi:hypothetical protein